MKFIDNLGSYLGIIAITTATFALLQAPHLYYAYAEYDGVSSLMRFMPPYAGSSIIINILAMPISWTVGFVSIAQMLPQDHLPFVKNKFAITIITLSILLTICVIINAGFFYSILLPAVSGSLFSSLSTYSTTASTSSAWNKAMSLMRCCGANGPADFASVAGLNATCGSNALSCTSAIEFNFMLLMSWSLLALMTTNLIALNGVCRVKIFSIISNSWGKVKTKIC